MLGEMVHGRMNGLTGCYDVSPSKGSTADAERRATARVQAADAENQARSDRGANVSIPVRSPLFSPKWF